MSSNTNDNVLTNENLLFVLEAESSKINQNEDNKDNEDNEDNEEKSSLKTKNKNEEMNNKSNKKDVKEEDDLIDEEDEEDEEEEIQEKINKNKSNQKTKKVKINLNNDDGSNIVAKLKKGIPFIGLGFLIIVLIISIIVMFSEPTPKKINVESSLAEQYPVQEVTNNKEEQDVTNPTNDNPKDNIIVDSDSLEKRKEMYRLEKLKSQNQENPLPEIDANSNSKNESSPKIIKDNLEFKQDISNSNSGKDFVVLNKDKSSVDNSINTTTTLNDTIPISSDTSNVNYSENTELQKMKEMLEIQKLNFEQEKLKIEQEKQKREEELVKKLEEIQQAKKSEAEKNTLSFKAKTNDVAINLFLINSNMAFLGGNLYTSQTIKVDKKIYTASFNEIEGKYYKIDGTSNYISIKQLEDNYIEEK